MPGRSVILAILLAFLLGLGFGRFGLPAKVVTKTEIREKIVTVTETSKASDVVTLRREIDKPDGTKIIRVMTVDKSVLSTQIRSDDVFKSSQSKTVENDEPQWMLRGLAAFDLKTRRLSYGAGLDRRILGPLFLGAFASPSGFAGLSIALSF